MQHQSFFLIYYTGIPFFLIFISQTLKLQTMTINQQVTFDTDKLNLFLNRTNKPHLKAYQEEILQIVNAVGTVCEWGIEVWGIMFPNNNKVNLPKKYLIVLS